MQIQTLSRCAAWVLLAAVTMTTLSPIELRPITGLRPNIERLLAFAGIGAAFGVGYPKHRLLILVSAAGAIGVLEALQNTVPGRHGHIFDFAVKVVGAGLGVGVARVGDQMIKRLAGSPSSRWASGPASDGS